MIVGIDAGNSTTIAYYEGDKGQGTTLIIPSDIAPGSLIAFEQTQQRSPSTKKGEHILTHAGADLYVGTLAQDHARWSSAGLGDNARYWAGHCKRLILTALAGLALPEREPIALATGMPFLLWADKSNQKRVIESLKGKHTIVYNAKERSFVIDRVLVLPEAGAALAAIPAVNGAGAGADRAILDIGGRTIDGYYSRAGAPAIDMCFSDTIGLQDIKDALQQKVTPKARPLGSGELDRIVYAASVGAALPVLYHAGQTVSYEQELSEAIDSVADRIIARAGQAWGSGLHTGPLAGAAAQIDVIGGGARLFAPRLAQRIPHATMAPDPHLCNALGFYRAGVEKWGNA